MTWWRPTPASSMVAEIGYDDENQDLLVRWAKSGKVSAYRGVDEGKAEELSQAPSVGSLINSDIKGFYTHRYV